MVGLDFFIASFAVGVGGTGWTLQGEVFPTAVRGQAAAIAFVFWFLPETRAMPVEEIVEVFERQKGTVIQAPVGG